jgi:hypothetical protein
MCFPAWARSLMRAEPAIDYVAKLSVMKERGESEQDAHKRDFVSLQAFSLREKVVSEAGVGRQRAVRQRAWFRRRLDSSRASESCRWTEMPLKGLSALIR